VIIRKSYPYRSWLMLIALVSFFGLESLRVLVTSVTWGFTREQIILFNLSPLALLTITILVILSPFFIVGRVSWSQLPRWLFWGGVFQSFFRIAEQISPWPILDFVLASLGVISFVLFYTVVYQVARSRFMVRGRDLAVGILIGVLIDSLIRGVSWTMALSWQTGPWPLLIVIGFSLLIIILSMRLRSEARGRVTAPIARISRANIIFGLYIFLIQQLFGNFSRVLIATGWSYNVVVLTVLFGNFLSVVGAMGSVFIYRELASVWTKITTIFFVCSGLLLTLQLSPGGFVLVFFVFQYLGSILLALVLELILSAPGHGTTMTMRRAYIGGFGLYVLFFSGYFGLGTSMLFFPLVAALIAYFSYRAFGVVSFAERIRFDMPRWTFISVLTFLAIVVLGGSGWVLIREKHPGPRGESPVSLKLMSFNAHQGLDPIGKMALADQAEFIRKNQIDVVGLNEVSLGWTINGGVDMLIWLSQELGYHYIFGPVVGPLQGNAFLSKYPLTFDKNHLYLSRSTLFTKGCLAARTELAGAPLGLAVTHLSWDNGDGLLKAALNPSWSGTEDPVRDAQSAELIAYCTSEIPTIIMGDMNTNPTSKSMQIIKAAGYGDAVDEGQCHNTNTYWSMQPFLRLDYILGPPEIKFSTCQIPEVLLSDHLPVVVTVAWE
jgi:endonuclease/exonuclease/phosphatase family metal-dependent hydrolase